ncbi:MAG: hypothetical protein IT306_01755 [Chloroflexi bacterium]|nr:hypothetical protein [Chloroflexota bacterium]
MIASARHPPTAEQMVSVVGRYLPERQAQGFVRGVLERATEHLVGFTIRPTRWNALDFA